MAPREFKSLTLRHVSTVTECFLHMKPPDCLRFCCAFLLLTILAATPSWGAPTPTPRVAIFSEPSFPLYGGVSDQISPAYLASELKKAGIGASLLGASALTDPARFNAKLYCALILTDGNTYPAQAFDNIRAFH